MSKQALESQKVRDGLKDVLLGPGQLYEALRERGNEAETDVGGIGAAGDAATG
jgi:type I restriction enzyme R subunit